MEERLSVTVENEGQKLFGVLHLPKNRTNQVPAVLVCHGLAGHKTGKHRVYVDLACRLSRRGIATLRFDYRGCGDSEGYFHEVTPSGHYSDALVLLEYLKQHPDIDHSRLGVFGRSFGGAVAVKTAAECACIRSLALWCPMYSSEQWQDQWQLVQTDSVDEKFKREMMQINGQQGSYQFFDEFFSISVSPDLQRIHHVPLLHIHGEVDKRVDIQHAHDYESSRVEAIGANKFLRLPNTDHDFSHFDERELALNETEQWFTTTLLK